MTLNWFLSSKQVRHPVDPPAPGRLELVKGLPRAVDGAGVGVHALLPPAALLDDEPGPLQHSDVLLHSREAHRVGLCESRDGGLAVDAATKYVATRPVGQGMKQLVELLLRGLIYNHIVVC